MNDWRPYEQCRENEFHARIEREVDWREICAQRAEWLRELHNAIADADSLRSSLVAMTAARNEACDEWEAWMAAALGCTPNPRGPFTDLQLAKLAELRKVGHGGQIARETKEHCK